MFPVHSQVGLAPSYSRHPSPDSSPASDAHHLDAHVPTDTARSSPEREISSTNFIQELRSDDEHDSDCEDEDDVVDDDDIVNDDVDDEGSEEYISVD